MSHIESGIFQSIRISKPIRASRHVRNRIHERTIGNANH